MKRTLTLDDFEERINMWHEDPLTEKSLHEYLGISFERYVKLVGAKKTDMKTLSGAKDEYLQLPEDSAGNVLYTTNLTDTYTFYTPTYVGYYKITPEFQVRLETKPEQKFIDNHLDMLGWVWVDL